MRIWSAWVRLNLVDCSDFSGFRGVTLHHQRFRAKIRHRGEEQSLGTYTTAEEVSEKCDGTAKKSSCKRLSGRLQL